MDPPEDERARKRARLADALAGSDAAEQLTCAICHELFDEPHLIRATMQTYCRACIVQHLGNGARPTCPLTGERVTIRGGNVMAALMPNIIARGMLDSQRIACRFAPACAERPKYGEAEAHERQCAHATVRCAQHARGCGFAAPRAEIAAHEAGCVYVRLAPSLDTLAAENAELKATVQGQQDTVRALQETVQG